MTTSKRQALVADIGGTHARFAISDIDELTIDHFAVFQIAMFTTLQDAVAHYLQTIPHKPEMASFAIAGPINSRQIKMTNAPFSFSEEDLKATTGCNRLTLVNEYAAMALALPFLTPHDVKSIHPGICEKEAPKVILGSGSGFGACALIKTPDGWRTIPGEGGHLSFGATNEREMAILKHLLKEYGHASLDHVLSGRGLKTIHSTITEMAGKNEEKIAPIDIVRRAEEAEDPFCIQTLICFSNMLARIASDFALTFDARGGVYLGGGIPPKILQMLDTNEFRDVFESKGRRSDMVSAIPVDVVDAHHAGLLGASIALSEEYPDS